VGTGAAPTSRADGGQTHPVSLCGEAEIPVRQVAEFTGHANPTTTEHIYTHVYKKADHADEMCKLGAMSRPAARHGNVIPLRG
jgi:integrase